VQCVSRIHSWTTRLSSWDENSVDFLPLRSLITAPQDLGIEQDYTVQLTEAIERTTFRADDAELTRDMPSA